MSDGSVDASGKHKVGRTESLAAAPFDFEAANREYASEKAGRLEISTRGARSRTAIITCVDSRCSPEHFFELPENETICLRNGGGRTADLGTLRSLTLIQLVSELKEVMVVHHKDCGALFYTEEWMRDQMRKSAAEGKENSHSSVAPAWVDTIPWLGYSVREGETERERLERSVREDVTFLRNHPLLKPTVKVTGWYYNLGTGIVEPVEC
ncbi:carbonic anhydrase [Xylogone sp. PMI_703]|nr:carbonic anhydrase [Xylogone sp. PMI_703]